NAIPTTAIERFGATFGRVFRTIASSFGIITALYSVLNLIRSSITSVVDFDKAMVNMSAIAGKSRADLKGLEVEIRNVAAGSLNTANAVADLATELIKLGTAPDAVVALLKPVNDLSIA